MSMSKLKELENRLRDEPDNLGLRVMVAGALHEAGRRDDAIELYRSVALVYRAQGRTQQAITVCHRILELAPDDVPCRELIDILVASQPATLDAPSGRLQVPPVRPSPSRLPWSPYAGSGAVAEDEAEAEAGDEPASRPSGDATPLPPAVPYHVAEPTVLGTLPRSALPPSLREEFDRYPQIAGIVDAAREISEALIAASPADEDAGDDHDDSFDLDTRRIQRSGAVAPADHAAPQVMFGLGDDDDQGDDDPTFPQADGIPRAHLDDERSAGLPANGVPHVRVDGAGRPTRRPARGLPRVRIIDDEKTGRRERPSRPSPIKE
jgi:hypothetical protein